MEVVAPNMGSCYATMSDMVIESPINGFQPEIRKKKTVGDTAPPSQVPPYHHWHCCPAHKQGVPSFSSEYRPTSLSANNGLVYIALTM